MRRHVPWVDFILYGGFALLSVVATVFVVVSSDELVPILVMGLVCAGFVLVALMVFLTWFASRPDFYVFEDTAVWTGDILGVTPGSMASALGFYATMLPQVLEKQNLSGLYVGITEKAILRMYVGARIEWSTKPVTLIGKFWAVRDKNGLQQGKGVMVRWMGSIRKSALFHELHHMVDEMIRRRPVDYNHSDKTWWSVVGEVEKEFERRTLDQA